MIIFNWVGKDDKDNLSNKKYFLNSNIFSSNNIPLLSVFSAFYRPYCPYRLIPYLFYKFLQNALLLFFQSPQRFPYDTNYLSVRLTFLISGFYNVKNAQYLTKIWAFSFFAASKNG